MIPENKKLPLMRQLSFLYVLYGSAFGNSADRACACAGTAVKACALVDDVLGLALGNSAYRAGVCTGTAGNAGIRNLICHFVTSYECSM